MTNFRFVFTGTGRCGTGFASRVLNYAGVKCGHEEVFGPWSDYQVKHLLENSNFEAVSSWLAAPRLGWDCFKHSRIIHLVRDPIQVINSILSINLFSAEVSAEYRNFAYRHLPEIRSLDSDLKKTVAFYVLWNKLIERNIPVQGAILFRVEDGPFSLLRKIGISTEKVFTFNKYNSVRRQTNVQIQDLPDFEFTEQFLKLKKEYGYG